VALRVVKLGGSLLGLPDLVPRLRSWLARQTPADTVLVVGGGALADAIRAAQCRHNFADSVGHWLCIRAMAIQAEMIAALLPEADRLIQVTALQPPAGRLWILDPWQFLREDERRLSSCPLPESWDVTSDSIAARLAEIVHADELVLLKSALPAHPTVAEMAEAGYVDRFFPQAAGAIAPLRFVNLRDSSCAQTIIAIDDRVRP
jgi:aspartokinase-like uncharacterized kinase